MAHQSQSELECGQAGKVSQIGGGAIWTDSYIFIYILDIKYLIIK